MDLFDIFIIFLVLAAIAPAIRQKIIETSRTRLIHEIQDKRKTRVIVLIQRQESMSLLGFPMARFIDIEDSEQILRAIRLTDPKVPLDLILHTPGGLKLAAEQIANALSRHTGKVTVFVPHYAMSGGTLIALAADEIVMDRNAVLGPVDPQIGQYPAASILNVLSRKNIDEIEDHTLILADISQKAVNQMHDTIQKIACCHYDEQKAEELASKLSQGNWTHDYPISFEEAKELGLNVSDNIPTEVFQLMNLYPQRNQHRPSVEFIPLPYPEKPDRPHRPGN